jgi:hypothetical protein
MNELICSARLNSEENKITVSGLIGSDLNLDISGDVDFTDLVKKLTEKIDVEKTIVFSIEDETSITDPKSKLILETLKKIFASYNNSIELLFEDEMQ